MDRNYNVSFENIIIPIWAYDLEYWICAKYSDIQMII